MTGPSPRYETGGRPSAAARRKPSAERAALGSLFSTGSRGKSWDFIADLMEFYSDSMGYEWDINGI